MRPIPVALRKRLSEDPFMKRCIREGNCSGRITWEHAFMYQNRQINEAFAIVPLCEKHHFHDLDKDYGRYIGLLRATPEELARYPKVDWKQKLEYLKTIYEPHLDR